MSRASSRFVSVAVASITVSTALIAGCASQKEFVPTGGSRSDGTVSLSYEYGMFEKPQVYWNHANTEAAQRCAAWGYSGAEAFGGTMQKCEAVNGYGNCVRWLVTATYQCTGAPAASR